MRDENGGEIPLPFCVFRFSLFAFRFSFHITRSFETAPPRSR
jgi:hypothetical protein